MIEIKDQKTLIRKPNDLLSQFHARVMIKDASNKLCEFYKNNGKKIHGDVVIVRSTDDYGYAANFRNNSAKVLFVFSEELLFVDSYFTGVCESIVLPKALIKRVNKS